MVQSLKIYVQKKLRLENDVLLFLKFTNLLFDYVLLSIDAIIFDFHQSIRYHSFFLFEQFFLSWTVIRLTLILKSERCSLQNKEACKFGLKKKFRDNLTTWRCFNMGKIFGTLFWSQHGLILVMFCISNV